MLDWGLGSSDPERVGEVRKGDVGSRIGRLQPVFV